MFICLYFVPFERPSLCKDFTLKSKLSFLSPKGGNKASCLVFNMWKSQIVAQHLEHVRTGAELAAMCRPNISGRLHARFGIAIKLELLQDFLPFLRSFQNERKTNSESIRFW